MIWCNIRSTSRKGKVLWRHTSDSADNIRKRERMGWYLNDLSNLWIALYAMMLSHTKSFDCGHIFHFKCLEEWRTSAVKSGTTQHCPMCRCKGVTQKTLFNSHKKCSSEIPLSCIEEKYQVCLVERERRRYFRSLILCNQIITMMKQIE